MRQQVQHRVARRALVLAAVSALAATGAALPARGPAPSVMAADDCVRGGVDVTAGNGGDAPFRFTLAGVAVTVEPGGRRTIAVPVAQHERYHFTVLGPNGFRQDVDGVRNCATPAPSPSAAPATDRAASAGPVAAAPRDAAAGAPTGRRQLIPGVLDPDSLVAGTALVLLGGTLFGIRRLTLV
ncbi:phospholipase domain-containing protein [Streptomyces sp. NPDC006711]|uniref:phospholipase domain-containing protein n=1 Tax=Streptomyces sp. NPDC006711 TaxID=3364762 RepID=UPI00369A9F9D